jgi:hypothetical protein
MTKTNLEKDSRDRKRQTSDEQLDKGKYSQRQRQMEVVHCEEDTFEVRKAIKSDVATVLPKMSVGCGNILYI